MGDFGLAMGVATVVVAGVYGYSAMTGAPSEAELRDQGHVDCANWEDSVPRQLYDSSPECIEDGELIEFGDSRFYLG